MSKLIKFVMLLGLAAAGHMLRAQTFPVENLEIKGLTPSTSGLCVPSVGGLVTNVGCAGLPIAAAAGAIPVSTGPGNTYTALPGNTTNSLEVLTSSPAPPSGPTTKSCGFVNPGSASAAACNWAGLAPPLPGELAACTVFGASGNTITVADNAGNIYTPGPSHTNAAISTFMQTFYSLIVAQPSTTTATLSVSSTQPGILCNTVNGMQAATDGSVVVDATSGPVTTPTLTTTQDGDYIFCTGVGGAGSGFSNGSPFTLGTQYSPFFDSINQYHVQATAGGITASITGSVTTSASLLCTAFKQSATPPAPVTSWANAAQFIIDNQATVEGLNNVLLWAPAVAINDGNVHTVGSAGGIFSGISTLAGLANLSINGATPFSWITALPFSGGGIYVIGVTNPGSGGTAGTFSLGFSGGGCGTEPTGTFTVGKSILQNVSGTITNVSLSTRGSGCTSAPAITTTASSGLTFATVVATYLGDSTVGLIDLSWLAIQSALQTGKTYIPAGSYLIGSTLHTPLMIPAASTASGAIVGSPSATMGDGYLATKLIAGADFGQGVPLLSAGDPAGTAANTFANSRYALDGTETFEGQLENVGLFSSAGNIYFTAFTQPIKMDGFFWGARLRTKDVDVNGFNHDWSIVGDHTEFIRPHADGGSLGFYWPTPSAELTGDLQFIDTMSEGQSIAAFDVANSAIISATFNGETYLSAPIDVYGEPGGACQPIFGGAVFDNFDSEFTMIAEIWDGNNFNGTTYTDANKCRNINSLRVLTLHNNFLTVDDTAAAALNIYRRALWDVSQVNDTVVNVQASSGSLSPNYASTSFSSSPGPIVNTHAVSSINALNIGGTLSDLLKFTGDIGDWIGQLQTLPMVNANVVNGDRITLEEPGLWAGRLLNVVGTGSYATTTANDVMEYQSGNAVAAGTSVANDPFAGILMQSGVTSLPQYVPTNQSGLASGTTGYIGFSTAYFTLSTGVGKLAFTAGTGGTTGTYPLAFSGGGCTTEPVGTFTVAGGVIASMTLSVNGLNCTSAPTVTLGGSSGITGSSQSVAWPSAQMQASSIGSSSAYVGAYNSDAGNGGSTALGTWYNGVDLSTKAPPANGFTTITTSGDANIGGSANVGGNLNANGFVLQFGSNSTIYAPSGGILRLTNNATTSFTQLNLGPLSSSFPELFVSGPILQIKDGAGGSAASIASAGYGQLAANNTGGSCPMSTSTSCTQTILHTYTSPICIATQQSGTLTGAAVGCTVSGTTVTVTAATANSETWGFLVFGNPN